MGNNQKRKKNRFQSFLEEFYNVSLFYKPTMQLDDIFFYIELDNLVRIVYKLIGNDIITIKEIIPLSNVYLNKFYEELINILMNQNNFTILISTIGNTSCIVNACIKFGIPLIDDNRFIATTDRLYDLLKNTHNDDISKYGMYIVAVNDNFNNVLKEKTKNNPAPTIIDVEREENDIADQIPNDIKSERIIQLYKFISSKYKCDISIDNETVLMTIMNKISLSIIDIDDYITITSFSLINNGSSIDALNFMNYLEKYKTDIIVLDNITNNVIYNLVKAKNYKSISNNTMSFNIKNSFGKYKIN